MGELSVEEDNQVLVPEAPPTDLVVVAGEAHIAVVGGAVGEALYPHTATPPVPRQSASHINAAKLESEKVVVAAPLSFAGSAARIWKLTGITANPWGRVGLSALAIFLILVAWAGVLVWYWTWGLVLVPYRIIRRGSRKRKREALQHREMLAALNQRDQR
jgi:Flp pilus assembly protein TadB